jgi:branched-subunit amino acid aminotransferase/4-amino-4-deoxychorismate lyase
MQLAGARLALPQRHGPVRVADLGSFAAVFITNSHGVAAVTEVDGRRLPVDTAFIGMLKGSYESVPWDEI